MYVIWMENCFCVTKREYLGEIDDMIVTYHSPYNAKQFKSKVAAQQWIKDTVSTFEHDKLVIEDYDFNVRYYEAATEQGLIYRKVQKRDKTHDIPYNKEIHKSIDVFNWRVEHIRNNSTYANYSTWPELFTEYECLFHVGGTFDLNINDYLIYVEMCVRPDTKFETFKEEFLLGDTVNNRVVDEKKVVKIFDRFLSEYGDTLAFHYNLDDNVFEFKRYRTSVEERFTSLEKAFDWWKKERYYD